MSSINLLVVAVILLNLLGMSSYVSAEEAPSKAETAVQRLLEVLTAIKNDLHKIFCKMRLTYDLASNFDNDLSLLCSVVSGIIKARNEHFSLNRNLLQITPRIKRQTQDHCFLPNHPANGKLKILEVDGDKQSDYSPNSRVIARTIIDLSCNKGFSTKTGGLSRAICFRGAWTPAISQMGGCTRTCLGVKTETDSYTVKCVLNNNEVSCENPKEGTLANVYCKTLFEYTANRPIIKCEDGTWNYAISPCIPQNQPEPLKPGPTTTLKTGICPSIKSDTDTYTVKCVRNYTKASCENPKEGTRAFVYCKPFFEYTASRPLIECINGSWNYPIIPCTAECGRKRVGVQALTLGGGDVLKNEYPWLTGIYYSSNRTHLCEGSIISRFYVLSAAHFFTTTRGVLLDKNDYLVAAGKYYRKLDDDRDQDQQTVKIEKIYVSEDYKGIIQNYAFDYAVLKLQQPFVLSSAIQPVCVDWNNKYETTDFTENNKGVVAGWGFTQEGSDPPEELKKLTVPYRHISTCIELLPKDFVEKYFTFDKFCAGSVDDKTSVCNGNSGGGLYFQSYENRYFIRGIVNFAPTNCGSNQFALYTRVSRHVDKIVEITGREA